MPVISASPTDAAGRRTGARLSMAVGALLGAAVMLAAAATARAATAEQDLVDRARLTVEKLLAHPDYSTLREWLKDARGVLIVPKLVKAGLVLGGEGGSGVLLSRDDEDRWSYPAFYRVASGSLGLQVGVQSSEVVFVIMTTNGFDSIVSNRLKFGADASIAVGPVGAGAEESTTGPAADIYAFSITRGVFGGVSFEGTLTIEQEDANAAYYGKGATSEDIVVRRKYANPGADGLRRALRRRK